MHDIINTTIVNLYLKLILNKLKNKTLFKTIMI